MNEILRPQSPPKPHDEGPKLPQTDEEIQAARASAFIGRMETALNANEIRIKATKQMIDNVIHGEGKSGFNASQLVLSDPNVMAPLKRYLEEHPSTISPEELDAQLREVIPKGKFE